MRSPLHVLVLAALASCSFIDPVTPHADRFTTNKYGEKYELIMSDEFNSSARQFGDGFDSLWTAVDTTGLESWRNGQMAIYNPQHATTDEGKLKITTTKSPDPLVNNGFLMAVQCFKHGTSFVSLVASLSFLRNFLVHLKFQGCGQRCGCLGIWAGK